MKAFWFPVATIVCALGAAALARAAETQWIDTGKAQVRLHADVTRAAVEIRLAPKWHTYWRYPGDAGVPPRFDWTGSDNLAATKVEYPVPRRFREAGGQVIGYENRVVFPVELKAIDPKKPVRLSLKFEFAVCEKICIPAEAVFSLDVPIAKKTSELIEQAKASIPVPDVLGEVKPLSVYSVKLERGAKPRVLVEIYTPEHEQDYDLFAEGPTDNWALPLPEKLAKEGNLTRYAIPLDGAPPGAGPIPAKIRLTVYAGGKSLEVEAPLD